MAKVKLALMSILYLETEKLINIRKRKLSFITFLMSKVHQNFFRIELKVFKKFLS